jgi:hypothetical protein
MIVKFTLYIAHAFCVIRVNKDVCNEVSLHYVTIVSECIQSILFHVFVFICSRLGATTNARSGDNS